jgi:P-type Ca2+ transporter type 2C
MAARGLRVIAVASGQLTEPLRPENAPPQPTNLTLHGFLGMIDPLRAGAREAVADCHRAGVLVSMVTGDHRVTALAIARDLGWPIETIRLRRPPTWRGNRLTTG